jgi:hypothetical protein
MENPSWRIVAGLLMAQALLLGWMGWTLCPNRTEVGHMGATVYFWHTLRFDVFHVNPPLTRMVSGLPVVLCSPKCTWDLYSSRPQDRSEWALGRAFIAANDPTKTRWCFALARWSLIPLVLLGGFFGHRLSGQLYGDRAAGVFLILWCVSPLLLAWGATICPDAVAASLGMVALYALRQWLCQPTWIRAGIAGVCLGLLPLTKLTWIVAFVLWPTIWCCWTLPGRWKQTDRAVAVGPTLGQLVAVVVLGVYTLNMGYLFDGTGHPLGQYAFLSHSLGGTQDSTGSPETAAKNRFAGTWLGAIPLPLPAEYVQGFDTQRLDFERGMPSYLHGKWSEHGWWYYYLHVLGVKMPLGTWCLALLAGCAILFRTSYHAAWRDELLILLPLGTLFAIVSSQTGFSAHPRYILPAAPLLFLWISKVGRGIARGHRCMVILTTLSLGWMVLSSLWSYPHSLSYFNELAGGPRSGAEHLLGSNLDWGQDLFYLEDWCQTHPNARPLWVAYDGMYPLEKTKINSAGEPSIDSSQSVTRGETSMTSGVPQPGWHALSVNKIYGQSLQFQCFRELTPVDMAGYSIYIYHITPNDVNRPRQRRWMPELHEESQTEKASSAHRNRH